MGDKETHTYYDRVKDEEVVLIAGHTDARLIYRWSDPAGSFSIVLKGDPTEEEAAALVATCFAQLGPASPIMITVLIDRAVAARIKKTYFSDPRQADGSICLTDPEEIRALGIARPFQEAGASFDEVDIRSETLTAEPPYSATLFGTT